MFNHGLQPQNDMDNHGQSWPVYNQHLNSQYKRTLLVQVDWGRKWTCLTMAGGRGGGRFHGRKYSSPDRFEGSIHSEATLTLICVFLSILTLNEIVSPF